MLHKFALWPPNAAGQSLCPLWGFDKNYVDIEAELTRGPPNKKYPLENSLIKGLGVLLYGYDFVCHYLKVLIYKTDNRDFFL